MTMDHKTFKVGDLVWAKMKGFQPWPAKIETPPKDQKSPTKLKTNHQYVFFFGSENYGWVLSENIVPHSDKMVAAANLKKKSTQMQNAIDEIVRLHEHAPKEKRSKKREPDTVSSEHSSKKSSSTRSKHTTRRQRKDTSQSVESLEESGSATDACAESNDRESDDMVCEGGHAEENGEGEVKTCSDLTIRMTFEKRKGVPSLPDSDPDEWLKVACRAEEFAKPVLSSLQEPSSEKKLSPPGTSSNASEKQTASSSDPTNSSSEDAPNPTKMKARPEKGTPDLDLKTVHEFVKAKNLVAINKKVGFLGLSPIGQGMVKSLLHTGHDVTVWNNTPERYQAFIDAGAKSAETPADVVSATDIILSYFPDSSASKEVVYGENGVLKGFEQSGEAKTYVEMTLNDVKASKDLRGAIEQRGGKFLEGGYYGTAEMAAQGRLMVIVAGEKAVCDECDTCFKAIARSVYYGGNRVGVGSVCNIALASLEGSVSSSVAKMMMVGKSSNAPQQATRHSCNLIKDTCSSILSQKISTKVLVNEKGSALRLLSSVEHKPETGNPVKAIVKSLCTEGSGEKDDANPVPTTPDDCPNTESGFDEQPSNQQGTSTSQEQPDVEVPTSEPSPDEEGVSETNSS